MKKSLATLMVLALLVGQAQAEGVNGGDFQLYVPGTDYTVTAELSGPGPFDSYVKGVGTNCALAGGIAEAYGADGSTNSTVDLPGWVSVHGGDPDTGKNGVEGSSGLNVFAAWGGDVRVETDSPVGTAEAGSTYTISAMVDGSANGPIEGELAFHLLANGTQLSPVAPLSPLTGGIGFQTISKTYDPTSIAGHVGEALTIMIGVADSNDFGGRMIWDNVSLTEGPNTTSVIILW